MLPIAMELLGRGVALLHYPGGYTLCSVILMAARDEEAEEDIVFNYVFSVN